MLNVDNTSVLFADVLPPLRMPSQFVKFWL